MIKTGIEKLRRSFRAIKEAVIRIQRKRRARMAEIEESDRKALVNELTKKFAGAYADCEQNKKASTTIEFSIKEIVFIEGYLESWNRYFKERSIYRPSPASNTQSVAVALRFQKVGELQG